MLDEFASKLFDYGFGGIALLILWDGNRRIADAIQNCPFQKKSQFWENIPIKPFKTEQTFIGGV